MSKIKYTYNYALWEIEQRIKRLKDHEQTAINAGEFGLAERMRIRWEELEMFLQYLQDKKDNKEIALIY